MRSCACGVAGFRGHCQSVGGSILLSFNGDFADIVTYSPERYNGIVALQVRNHPEVLPPLMARLIAYLKAQPAREDYQGKLFVVEVDRIRIRE